MISPDQFYSEEDNPLSNQKEKVWKKINSEFKSKSLFEGLDFRSYSFGIATAVIIFFAVIGLISIVDYLDETREPEIVKLNETYSHALAKLEELTKTKKNYTRETNLDELMAVKKENLRGIDRAIIETNLNDGDDDISYLRQLHLLELYRIKLKLIEDIIIMGEK